DFYAGLDGIGFTPDEPWTLFEMPELAVVVAGLNSTIAESHRDGEHHGWLGEHQLRWFARRLADYRARGWLRLGAVPPNPVRGGAGRCWTRRTCATSTTSTGGSAPERWWRRPPARTRRRAGSPGEHNWRWGRARRAAGTAGSWGRRRRVTRRIRCSAPGRRCTC